ncbi:MULTISPECIES: transcription elongation factor GreA [Lysinibacillus]|uniref:Transcription elongation factor GreA n=2 Tax=Lysinibacillus TaxID=400634 RepID=A0A544UIC4_LYSSH|nr:MULTISPECIES: transcription elongation factor GreA [Lysinibacillus]QPQ29903.1 transcription elongation factor GreA [Lysinibacillus sp. JNUCC-51]KMY30417.1 transcription elongation factor GreA [Lysinibacillus xylanilyticus]MCY9547341.1 transcription elongation factor GreA [Lysinibacillus xylanilyticus]MDD1503578.1 transcription elongation factor GreA [Lysinibacillus sp. CNPSo 3705]MEB2279184.1 transcription elongation factor GreA [Lysinibacillus xylanilyticus]
MANEKQYPMTAEGKRKLEEELVKLETETRKEIVERIKIARDFGDLSENAEYDSAKEEQAFLEGRISTLKSMIRNAVIISEDETDNSVVSLGKTVTFVEVINGKPSTDEESYTIVGSAEADPMEFRISNESPIAKGLLGRAEGEEVVVQTPGGEMKVKIISIK